MRKLVYIPILIALALPSTAAAHQHRHARKAQTPTQLIRREVGPGTIVGPCWPIRLGVRCDYSTPSANFGIYFEEEWNGFKPESGTLSSFADVIHGRVLFPT